MLKSILTRRLAVGGLLMTLATSIASAQLPLELVADVAPGTTGSNPRSFTVFKDKLYFVATTPANGDELWATDGSTTTLVADIAVGTTGSNPAAFTIFKDRLYFTATNASNGTELWATDGITTNIVADLVPGAGSGLDPTVYFVGLPVLDEKLYFVAQGAVVPGTDTPKLFAYDGVHPPQPVLHHGSPIVAPYRYVTAYGSALYLHVRDSAFVTLLNRFIPSTDSLWAFPHPSPPAGNYGKFKGHLLYTTSSPPPPALPWVQGWMIDTATLISTPYTPQAYELGSRLIIGDTMYYGLRVSSDARLTRLVWPSLTPAYATSAPNYIRPNRGLATNHGRIYFCGDNTAQSYNKLFFYDIVADTSAAVPTYINASLPPDFLFPDGNFLYFSAYSSGGAWQAYLWRMTSNFLIQALGTSGTNPSNLVGFGNTVYFSGVALGAGRELMRVPAWLGDGGDMELTPTFPVYPNPASQSFTVALPSLSPHSATLLSPTGATIRTLKNLRGPSATIPVEDLPPGLYLLRLTDESSGAPAGSARFVKQ